MRMICDFTSVVAARPPSEEEEELHRKDESYQSRFPAYPFSPRARVSPRGRDFLRCWIGMLDLLALSCGGAFFGTGCQQLL